MADEKASSKGKAGKKKKQQMYLLAGLGVGVVYYLYTKYKANQATAATSTGAPSTGAIDPLTGQPYQAGVGSLASNALGGGSGTPSGGGAIDPLTGQPYAAGVGSLAPQTGGGIDPATGQTYASEISSLQSQLLGSGTSSTTPTTIQGLPTGNISPPTTLTPSSAPSVPSPSRSLSQWKGGAIAQLVKFGVTPGLAAKSVNQYLNGQAITNPLAAHGLSNIISPANSLGAPPTAHGPAPTVRVAKTKTPAINVPKPKPLIRGPVTRPGGGGTLVHGL